MSNQRPVSMDVAQEDEYGSDDDNEIDRINREKKETLQLSMDDIKMIKKVSASVVRAMGKIVVPEDESSDDDDEDKETSNSDDEKVLYNFRGVEINQKYKIHTHAVDSLFKIRERLIKFDDNITTKLLPVKQSVQNRSSSTLYRPFFTCLKSGIHTKLKALFNCLSVNYEYTLTLEAIKVVITLVKDYNRIVKKLASIKLMKKSEQISAFSGMGLIGDYLSAMIQLKATLASVECGQVITKFFLDAYDKFEKSKTSKNSDIKVLTVDLYRTFLFMESLLQIDVQDNISKAADRHEVLNAQFQLVVNYKALLNFVPLLLSEVKHDNDSLNAYGLWVSIMKITGYITRDHSAREMFTVCKDGGIVDISQVNTDAISNAQVVIPQFVPPPRKALEHNKGGLSSVLSRERANRLKLMDSSRRHGMAQFSIPLRESSIVASTSASNDTTTNEDKTKAALPRANKVIVRDICGSSCGKSAAADSKSNKKNLTFAADDIIKSSISMYSDSQFRGRACNIAANIIDRMCSSNALYMLIERVFEDRLRDPDNEKVTITDGTEFIFYRIVTACLQYTRLNLENEKSKRSHSPYDENGNVIEWVPNLRPVIQGLTRTMINRVVGTLEILEGDGKSASKDCSNVQYPMELFKEIICYFGKVMFDSANTGHHDTAISQLYYIFYRPSERNDPLPKLAKEWKTGTYSRQHLNIMIELIHETMKTLDIAHGKYKTDAAEDKRTKSKLKDGRLADYITGCRRFSPDDYFKRLVSNHSVNIYTRLLANCSDNDKRTNHYIFSFLQRMCNFTLEQDCPTASQGNTEGATQSSVNLGYLLFNVTTLNTLSTIINDVTIAANPSRDMQQLVKLANSIIRKFFEVANKNRCLYVEALFRHPHAHEFVLEIDSIYKASEYVRSQLPKRKDRYDPDDRAYSPVAATANDDWTYDNVPVKSKLDDLGDEFDEDDLPETFYKTKKSSRRARSSRRQYGSDSGEDDSNKKSSKKYTSSRQWTKEEDRILKEQYKVYGGSRSAYDYIAQHEELVAIGRNRTSKSVARRIRELKLHLVHNDGSSDDEEQSADEKSFHDSESSDNNADEDDDSDDGKSDEEEVDEDGDAKRWSVTEQVLLKELYKKYLADPNIFDSIITDASYASYKRTAEEVEDKIFSLGLQHDDSVPNEDTIEFSVEQDLQIRLLYTEYKDNPNVFDVIAADTVFSNGDNNGKEIAADDIARRVFEAGIDPSREYVPKSVTNATTTRDKKPKKEKVKKSKKEKGKKSKKSKSSKPMADAPVKSRNSSPGTDVEARYSDDDVLPAEDSKLTSRVVSSGWSDADEDEPRKSKKSRLSKSKDKPVMDDDADVDFFNDAGAADKHIDIIRVSKKRGRIDSDEDE